MIVSRGWSIGYAAYEMVLKSWCLVVNQEDLIKNIRAKRGIKRGPEESSTCNLRS